MHRWGPLPAKRFHHPFDSGFVNPGPRIACSPLTFAHAFAGRQLVNEVVDLLIWEPSRNRHGANHTVSGASLIASSDSPAVIELKLHFSSPISYIPTPDVPTESIRTRKVRHITSVKAILVRHNLKRSHDDAI